MTKVSSLVAILLFTWYGGLPVLAQNEEKRAVISPDNLDQVVELTVLEGHSKPVFSVTFSPDGTILASGSVDRTIRLWNGATGESYHILQITGEAGSHISSEEIKSLAYGPNGRFLAAGGGYGPDYGAVRLWDVQTGENVATLERPHAVETVQFNPSGTILVFRECCPGGIRLWDIETRSVKSLVEASAFSSLAYAPDGILLAIGSSERSVQFWDTLGEKWFSAPLSGFPSQAINLTFGPDGTVLALVRPSGEIWLWDIFEEDQDLFDLEATALKGHHGIGYEVAFSPDGTLLALASSDHRIWLWDIAKRDRVTTLEGHTDYVHSVAFNPDGTLLASGSWDGTVRLWGVP